SPGFCPATGFNAAQGTAKYFSPIPKKPPKPRTAYSICPRELKTTSLMSPRLSPCVFSTSAPMNLLPRYRLSDRLGAAKAILLHSKLPRASMTAPVFIHLILALLYHLDRITYLGPINNQ